MMSTPQHRWFPLPPDTTVTDAVVYEVCRCGAKRQLLTNYYSTARTEPIAVWVNGPHTHPIGVAHGHIVSD